MSTTTGKRFVAALRVRTAVRAGSRKDPSPEWPNIECGPNAWEYKMPGSGKPVCIPNDCPYFSDGKCSTEPFFE